MGIIVSRSYKWFAAIDVVNLTMEIDVMDFLVYVYTMVRS